MTQEENYNLSIHMKDKSVQKLSVTRTDAEQWLTDHNKAKLICPDTDELIARFTHAYQLDYNKNHPLPKGTLGGKREGAGRKAKGGDAGPLRISFRCSRDVYEILQRKDNKTDYIERAIRFYHKREEL